MRYTYLVSDNGDGTFLDDTGRNVRTIGDYSPRIGDRVCINGIYIYGHTQGAAFSFGYSGATGIPVQWRDDYSDDGKNLGYIDPDTGTYYAVTTNFAAEGVLKWCNNKTDIFVLDEDYKVYKIGDTDAAGNPRVLFTLPVAHIGTLRDFVADDSGNVFAIYSTLKPLEFGIPCTIYLNTNGTESVLAQTEGYPVLDTAALLAPYKGIDCTALYGADSEGNIGMPAFMPVDIYVGEPSSYHTVLSGISRSVWFGGPTAMYVDVSRDNALASDDFEAGNAPLPSGTASQLGYTHARIQLETTIRILFDTSIVSAPGAATLNGVTHSLRARTDGPQDIVFSGAAEGIVPGYSGSIYLYSIGNFAVSSGDANTMTEYTLALKNGKYSLNQTAQGPGWGRINATATSNAVGYGAQNIAQEVTMGAHDSYDMRTADYTRWIHFYSHYADGDDTYNETKARVIPLPHDCYYYYPGLGSTNTTCILFTPIGARIYAAPSKFNKCLCAMSGGDYVFSSYISANQLIYSKTGESLIPGYFVSTYQTRLTKMDPIDTDKLQQLANWGKGD